MVFVGCPRTIDSSVGYGSDFDAQVGTTRRMMDMKHMEALTTAAWSE